MTRTIVDIHVLQTVPPSNLNRDDTGSPKTAIYGGVRRARVSSQAWKRAVRLSFKDVMDVADLGVRTKRLGELIAERIARLAPDLEEQSGALATDLLTTAGLVKEKNKKDGKAAESEYLMFLSNRQLDNLAAEAVDASRTGSKLDAKKLQRIADTNHSIDVAMFGRMVADLTDINVDAAVQVAHAISVHAVDNEYDYFTAIDDRKEDVQETGAGMIGTVEFNSATLYRYATIDVDRLHETLGDAAATTSAVEAFIRAFVTSMPTGKQNTFANRTLPDAVVVRLRSSQAINFVGAFETPVRDVRQADGRIAQAAEALAGYAKDVEDAFGEQPVATWVTHVGERTQVLGALGTVLALPQLITSVGHEVTSRLGARA